MQRQYPIGRDAQSEMTSARLPFIFDVVQARRLLAAAAALRDNPRAQQRGPTYRVIFALCYGLGLRAGEACGLRLGDVDTDRSLLVVRGGKFGKSRFVPHGPRIAQLLDAQVGRRLVAYPASDAKAPLFTFLLRMLGDRERAEDLAQETFLRIVKGAAAWEQRARFQTWLYTIARNLCVDASRRDKFRRADSLDETGPSTAPQTELLALNPNSGNWSVTVFGTIADCHTRPQIVIDTVKVVVAGKGAK